MIPGSRQGSATGTPDTIEAARTYLTAILGEHASDERLDVFLKLGPMVLDDLERRTSVRFAAPPVHPDYRTCRAQPSAAARSAPLPFDGRKLGADFDRLRPPRREFTVLGGLMVGKNDIAPLLHPFGSPRNLAHVARLLARHALDRLRFPRGTQLIMGNALAARLFYDLRRSGGTSGFSRASRN